MRDVISCSEYHVTIETEVTIRWIMEPMEPLSQSVIILPCVLLVLLGIGSRASAENGEANSCEQ